MLPVLSFNVANHLVDVRHLPYLNSLFICSFHVVTPTVDLQVASVRGKEDEAWYGRRMPTVTAPVVEVHEARYALLRSLSWSPKNFSMTCLADERSGRDTSHGHQSLLHGGGGTGIGDFETRIDEELQQAKCVNEPGNSEPSSTPKVTKWV